MTDNAPVAKIVINGEVEERTVCSVEMRTRGDGGNTIRLTGGVDLKVDDEFAAGVLAEYMEGVLEDRD